jgi:hypothetical protein
MSGLRGLLLTLLLLMCAATAAAQTPPAAEDVDDAVAGEAETAPSGEARPAETDGQAMSNPADLVEEDPGLEAKADEEFTPEDEISEDYPVPLPSDI